jgi:hypothetical protein
MAGTPESEAAHLIGTMEQVRQILGFGTRIQVDAFLRQHGIYDYTVEDLVKDMATPDRVLGANSR